MSKKKEPPPSKTATAASTSKVIDIVENESDSDGDEESSSDDSVKQSQKAIANKDTPIKSTPASSTPSISSAPLTPSTSASSLTSIPTACPPSILATTTPTTANEDNKDREPPPPTISKPPSSKAKSKPTTTIATAEEEDEDATADVCSIKLLSHTPGKPKESVFQTKNPDLIEIDKQYLKSLLSTKKEYEMLAETHDNCSTDLDRQIRKEIATAQEEHRRQRRKMLEKREKEWLKKEREKYARNYDVSTVSKNTGSKNSDDGGVGHQRRRKKFSCDK